jgi:hypothetical protein
MVWRATVLRVTVSGRHSTDAFASALAAVWRSGVQQACNTAFNALILLMI